jgi:hypothetical protein
VSTSPLPNDPATADDDAQVTEGGSSFDNAETAVGGADAVPDDPDVNTRQAGGSLPGGGDGPGAGLSAPENR